MRDPSLSPASVSSFGNRAVKPGRVRCNLAYYGWTFWLPIALAGGFLMAVLALLAACDPHTPCWYWTGFGVVGVLTLAALAFFRDPDRRVPVEPDIMVSPADGTVTEITPLASFGPLETPVVRLGIFLSVLDVHLNRAPCDAIVLQTTFRPGQFLDARHPSSGARNQSNTLVLGDPQTEQPNAVVKQIVGAIARRIIAPVHIGQPLARGQRFGMIAFGSRTELYLPAEEWVFTVQVGQKLKAGSAIVARRKKR
jgi:phosphatidylserine decarboxylase